MWIKKLLPFIILLSCIGIVSATYIPYWNNQSGNLYIVYNWTANTSKLFNITNTSTYVPNITQVMIQGDDGANGHGKWYAGSGTILSISNLSGSLCSPYSSCINYTGSTTYSSAGINGSSNLGGNISISYLVHQYCPNSIGYDNYFAILNKTTTIAPTSAIPSEISPDWNGDQKIAYSNLTTWIGGSLSCIQNSWQNYNYVVINYAPKNFSLGNGSVQPFIGNTLGSNIYGYMWQIGQTPTSGNYLLITNYLVKKYDVNANFTTNCTNYNTYTLCNVSNNMPYNLTNYQLALQTNLSGNYNVSDNVTTQIVNSCTYSSGNWLLNLADHCNLTTPTNLSLFNMTFYGGVAGDYCNISTQINASYFNFSSASGTYINLYSSAYLRLG